MQSVPSKHDVPQADGQPLIDTAVGSLRLGGSLGHSQMRRLPPFVEQTPVCSTPVAPTALSPEG